MSKTFFSLFSFSLGLGLFALHLQAASFELPGEILMDKAEGHTDNPIYAPVLMPHQAHISLGCESCHHTWEDKSSAPQTCTSSGCHEVLGATGPQMQEADSAFNAYHNRESSRSCLGCHIQRDQADAPCGPFAGCTDCHPTPKQ
jgi:hypothetical protein